MPFPWLGMLLITPLTGSAVVLALPHQLTARDVGWVAMGESLITLGLALAIASRFDAHAGGRFQFAEQHQWIRSFGAHYALGLDGLGLAMVVMTSILTPVVLVASWRDDRSPWATRGYLAWILVLESVAIGVFAATDVFLFFCFFEASLLPIFFLTIGFGRGAKNRSAIKFLLFSLTGGLIMLAAVIGLHVASNHAAPGDASYLFSDLSSIKIDPTTERWLFTAFMFAFAVKAPMVPLHTW